MFQLKLSTVKKGRGADLARILRAIAQKVEQIPDDIDIDDEELYTRFEPVYAEDGWFIEHDTHAADGKRNGVWILDDSVPTAAHKIGDTVKFVGRTDCMAPLQEGARGTVTEVLIDGELWLLAAVRRVTREYGAVPSIGPVDELLDERNLAPAVGLEFGHSERK